MHVYFDGTQVNDNYIYELTKEQTLFSDTFQLGCTPMVQYKLTIEKTADTNPSVVTIKDNSNNLLETLLVDNREDEDDLTVTYSLVDKMSLFEFNYDASPLIPEEAPYPTLLQILQNICSEAGVTLATTTFNGSSKRISWYDSRITAREYIGYIAELNGGYACMNASGQLQLKQFNGTAVDTIAVADCENFKLGEQHVISRVVYDNGIGVVWTYGNETGDTVYLDTNNVYITTQGDVQTIYNGLNGFTYYSLSVDNCPIGSAKIGDTIAFTLDGSTYKTIAQIDQTYAGDSWYGGYKLDVKSSKQAETRVIDAKTMVKTIEVVVDRELGQIETTISGIETQVETANTNASTALTNSTTAINTAKRATKLTATDYAVSASGTVTPSSWPYSSIPSVSPGQYLWTRETYKDGNNNTSYVYSVSYQGANGQDGHNGQDGQDGQDGLSLKSATPLWYLKDANMNFDIKGNTTQSATPTPTAPQTVHTVNGTNNIIVCGKNLLDLSNGIESGSNAGIEVTKLNDYSYSLEGMAESSTSNIWLLGAYGTYSGYSSFSTLSKKSVLFTFPSGTYTIKDCAIFFVHEDGTKASYSPTIGNSQTITVTKKAYVVAIRVPAVVNTTQYNTTIYPQVVKGSTATDFEPYNGTTYSLSFPVENLCSYINSRETNGITFTYDSESGGVSVKGTASSNAYSDTTISATLVQSYCRVPPGTYTYSLNGGNGAENDNIRLYCQYWYDDGTNAIVANNVKKSQTFTTTQAGYIYTRVSVMSGATVGEVVYPQLERGATASPFVPHKPIIDNLNQQDDMSDGFLPQTGAYPENNVSWPDAQYFIVDMKRGETLVLKGSTNSNGRVRIIQDGVVKEGFIQTDTYARTNTSFSSGFREGYITALQDLQLGIMFLIGWRASGGPDLTVYKLKYDSTTPLELCKIGTYQDYIYQSGDKWYVHKATEKIVFNGSETEWNFSDWGTATYKKCSISIADIITSISDSTTSPIYSDRFRASSYNANGENTITGRYNNAQINIFQNAVTTSKADWLTWLASNNVTVYYVRANALDIEITNPTLIEQLGSIALSMNSGPSTVVTQTNSGASIDLTYNNNFSMPTIPSELVTTQEDSPDVWTLIQPSYLLGYRYYSLSQIIYEDDTFSFTDVLSEDGVTNQAYLIETNQLLFVKTTTELTNNIVNTNAGTLQTIRKEVNQQIITAKGEITGEYQSYVSTTIDAKAGEITETFERLDNQINNEEDGLAKQVTGLNTVITRNNDGITISSNGNAGVTIKQDGGNIRGQFTANSLDFIGNGQKLAWVNANDGLGGRKLSLASNPSETARWNITPNGTHLTFTRHN